MDVYIERLQDIDTTGLYNFELENRTFFEATVPSRGDDYYNPEIFKTRQEALLEEQVKGSYIYLIKEKNGSIIGRINIVDIDESNKIGHLGYRVAQAYNGKGIASIALKILLGKVVEEGRLKQIKAQTTTNNIASQKVLERNGFEKIATSSEEFEMNGQKLCFVYYALTLTPS